MAATISSATAAAFTRRPAPVLPAFMTRSAPALLQVDFPEFIVKNIRFDGKQLDLGLRGRHERRGLLGERGAAGERLPRLGEPPVAGVERPEVEPAAQEVLLDRYGAAEGRLGRGGVPQFVGSRPMLGPGLDWNGASSAALAVVPERRLEPLASRRLAPGERDHRLAEVHAGTGTGSGSARRRS